MDVKLIYLLIISFAAGLLSSCTSGESDEVLYGKGSEMIFDTSYPSRASVTTSIDRFAVYGDKKPSADNTATQTVIFNNKEVVHANDGSWNYVGEEYWVAGHEYSFVALNPVSLPGIGSTPSYSNSTLSFLYTIPTSAIDKSLDKNNGADILVATHRRLHTKDDNPTPISLRFGHIMSLINLAPAFSDNSLSSNDYMLVHELEFSGISTQARFEITPAKRQTNSQTDDMVAQVSAQGRSTFTVGFKEPVKVENKNINTGLFADDDALIMLPQIFAADSDAKITMSYSVNEDPAIKQVTIPLSDLKWESGKSYVYKFTIEMTGMILGDCKIEPWNPIIGENINVY